MSIKVTHIQPPSDLADVLIQVRDAFAAEGDATPLMCGANYLDHGVGVDPYVIFVPLTDGGSLEFSGETGDAATTVEACQVFVRAAAGGDDFDRFKRSKELTKKVIAHLRVAGTGRLTGGPFTDSSPLDTDEYGAEITFGFQFRSAIRHDAARWELPAADESTDPAQPRVPPGEAGTLNSLEVEVNPKEPA